jgi:sulfonate transport system permease protein
MARDQRVMNSPPVSLPSRPLVNGTRAYRSSIVLTPGRAEMDPARAARRRRRLDLVLAVGTPVVLIVIWQSSAVAGLLDERYWPAPSAIWSAGVELARSGELWDAVWASWKRALIGFSIGSSAGIAAGIVLGMFRTVRIALEPVMYAFWTVPKLALLPLLLLMFGIGEAPLIVLVVLATFFVMLIPTLVAVASVPTSFREPALSFDASRAQLLRHVLFPAALPQIFIALRLAAGVSILVLIGAEFVQAKNGLGQLIWRSWSLFLADRMYVGIVIVSLSGALFAMAIAMLGRRVLPWVEEH